MLSNLFPDFIQVYGIDNLETSLNAIELNNDEASVLELTVQLSYKDWFSKEGDQVTQNDGFAEGLAGTLISKFL